MNYNFSEELRKSADEYVKSEGLVKGILKLNQDTSFLDNNFHDIQSHNFIKMEDLTPQDTITVGELFTLIEEAYAKMQDSREKSISFTAYENAKLIILSNDWNQKVILKKHFDKSSLVDSIDMLNLVCNSLLFRNKNYEKTAKQQLIIAITRAYSLKEKE